MIVVANAPPCSEIVPELERATDGAPVLEFVPLAAEIEVDSESALPVWFSLPTAALPSPNATAFDWAIAPFVA